ncbi:MAG TPA: hypothetical protein VF097_09600 [Actinomycetota bacterium]
MNARRRLIIGLVAALAVIGVSTAVVVAASGDDQPLPDDARARATAAALDHVGGGRVLETEIGDDGMAYGVEILKPDGSVVEVSLDEDFQVARVEADDDGARDAEGPDDD